MSDTMKLIGATSFDFILLQEDYVYLITKGALVAGSDDIGVRINKFKELTPILKNVTVAKDIRRTILKHIEQTYNVGYPANIQEEG